MLWQMYTMAKTWSCRPSDLLGLQENSHTAFCFDRACAVFGNALKAELDAVEGKKKKEIERKREQILSKWFNSEARSTEAQPKKFRDPGSAS